VGKGRDEAGVWVLERDKDRGEGYDLFDNSPMLAGLAVTYIGFSDDMCLICR